MKSYYTENIQNWENRALESPINIQTWEQKALSEHKTIGKHKTLKTYKCPGNRGSRENRSQVIEVIKAPRNTGPREYNAMRTRSQKRYSLEKIKPWEYKILFLVAQDVIMVKGFNVP